MSNMFNFLADGSDSEDDTPKQTKQVAAPAVAKESKPKNTRKESAPAKKSSGGRGGGDRSNNRGGRGGGKGTRGERRTNARNNAPRGDRAGGRTGFAGRGREYDRRSGTGRSGPSAEQRKDGAGGHNWGSDADMIKSADADQEAVSKDVEAAVAEGEEGADPAVEVVEEEEDNEMTLEEYQAQLAAKNANSEAFKTLERREVVSDFGDAQLAKKDEEEDFCAGQEQKLRKKNKQKGKKALDGFNFRIESSESSQQSESRGKGKGKGKGRSNRGRDSGFKSRGKGGGKGGSRSGINVNDSSAFPTLG